MNDAYNANPESMAAALKSARWMAKGERLVAVLGHMAELGPVEFEEHERLGQLVVRIGVERLITVGEEARAIARAAIREGQLPEDVASYEDPSVRSLAIDLRRYPEIKEALEKSMSPGSQTFEQALFKLFMDGKITQDEAMANADSATNMLWLINQATAGEITGQSGQSMPQKPGEENKEGLLSAGGGSSFGNFKIDMNA